MRPVQLHLSEACSVVGVHDLPPGVGIAGDRRAKRIRASAVDEAGQEQLRADTTLRGKRVAKRGEEAALSSHVAHGGHASRQVRRSPLDLADMAVHVPQAGHDGFSTGLNDSYPLWQRDLGAAPH